LNEEISRSGVKEGIFLVFTLHTTTAITINEAESGLWQDLLERLAYLIPRSKEYRHCGDDNAHAHIQASLLGNSAVIPVERGSLLLGTWQRVLFLELDGPRARKVYFKIVS
jgi:secondary thiamine-phosphate synthase enzyme